MRPPMLTSYATRHSRPGVDEAARGVHATKQLVVRRLDNGMFVLSRLRVKRVKESSALLHLTADIARDRTSASHSLLSSVRERLGCLRESIIP